MKNLSLKISVAAFVLTVALMAGASMTSQAADPEGPQMLCADLWVENQYGKADQSTQKAMQLYHKTINAKFNEYTKKMILAQTEASKTGVSDPNSSPPDDGECTAENYSTYCVSRAMLIGEGIGGRDGYMDYLKALECRRTRIFDTMMDQLSYSDIAQSALSLGYYSPSQIESEYPAQYQLQKTLAVSGRVAKIDREITASKQALDVTLATYDELKTAWTMHKRYVNIYKNLVKFRDKMVEIRHHVEEYPSKFIDATTTMCT